MKEEDIIRLIKDSVIHTNITMSTWEKYDDEYKWHKMLVSKSFELNGLFKNFLARFIKTYASSEDIKRTIRKLSFELSLSYTLTGVCVSGIVVRDYGEYMNNQSLAGSIEKAIKNCNNNKFFNDCYSESLQVNTDRWVSDVRHEVSNLPPTGKMVFMSKNVLVGPVSSSLIDKKIKDFNLNKIKEAKL